MGKDYIIDEKWIEANEPEVQYGSDLTYSIIGACFEVHNGLGKGFSEVVYKDAFAHELQSRGLIVEREKRYDVTYKDIILPHYYYADFVVNGEIILEIKAQQNGIESHISQLLNYLAAAKCEIGLLINFGEASLRYKRVILTKD